MFKHACLVVSVAGSLLTLAATSPGQDADPIRVGIIGLDTSHAIAFTKILNGENPEPDVAGCRVVAAYPKGSPDIESSVSRVPGYTEEVKKLGVEIVDSIDTLLTKVDVVLLETNDGRPHLEQVRPVLAAGKPVFIDKPIAGSLADAVTIFREAEAAGVPVFSSSSLRYGKNTQQVRGGSIGRVTYCETHSPASLEPSHPDLFWYGIHGVESLFTVMGTGCQSVRRSSEDGQIVVTGSWEGDRVGIFREGKGYGGRAVGEKGEAEVGSYDTYRPLVVEIVTFFKTHKPPVSAEETLEIYAFMEAADESKRQRGAEVTIESVMAAARAQGDSVSHSNDRRPNFIVVFCDNLGYGDIEPFGSTLHRTPHLNRMAREGRKFTHFCVTAGVCTPSRASLMTGCYPQRVGMHTNERDGWVLRPVSPYGLNPEEITIAEVLKDQGYATAIIGKWHLGDQPQFLPTRQGFDWFFGVPYSDDMTARVWDQDGSTWPPLPLMENETVIEAPCDRDGLTKRYTEQAIEWITAHKEEPFFLYFPQAMPGSTKTPFSSPQFRGKSQNGPWGDAIEELDWSMGVLLDHLVELGIDEETLVVWTSDNGAPINADPADLSRGSNQPLHGRGYTTSEGAFRVPTLVWQPGRVPAGTTCDELATTMDLLPTFARLAGGRPPSDRIIDGHDISPLLFGEAGARSPYEAFYYYQQEQLQAVRSGRWKLFLPLEAGRHPHFTSKQRSQPLLFDLIEDVGSERNVAAAHPDVVARLTELAAAARADLGDSAMTGVGQRSIGRIPPDSHPQPLLLQ